jgi:translocation and assembly module TamA
MSQRWTGVHARTANMKTTTPGHTLRARPLPVCALVLLLILAATPAAAGVALRITIEGVGGALRSNVLGYLAIEQNRTQPGLTDAQVALLHRRAPDEIRAALEPFGYYRASVESTLERDAQGGWHARYLIDPGEAIAVAKVAVELQGGAADDPAFARLLRELPVREGRPLRHADYDRTRDALVRLATERGYLDARLTRRELRVDLDAYVAEVHLTLDSGRRYRFGPVRFDQQELDDDLLRGYLPFATGDPYDGGKVLELQGALVGSDYFTEVRVVPRVGEPVDDTIPVDVTLVPRRSQRYTFGVGYGTDTGMRGRVGWDWRPVNRHGHALAAGVELAEQRNSGVVRYSIPVRDPRTDKLDFTATLREEESETTDSQIAQVGTALTLGRGRWQQILSLNYKHEESAIGSERQEVDLVIPGVNWIYRHADDLLRVQRGYRLEIDLHGGSELLGSDVSFGQLTLAGKHIASPWTKGRLIARWEVGTTWTDDFDDLPASERYFAGGDESIRGYDWRTQGPVNDAGEVIGGPYLAIGSLEVEHYFGSNWGLALFVDAGNAFDDQFDDPVVGAGIGLRWKTPIGAVRIDVAQAVSEGNTWRLHLQIGPEL